MAVSRPNMVVRWRRMDGAEPSRPVGESRLALAVFALAASAVTLAAVFFGGSSGDGSVVWVGGAAVALAAGGFFTAGVRLVRLHSPVGYWNGLALLADAALALGLWLAVVASGRRELRAAGHALVYLAVLSGLLTSSRAGVLGGLLALGLWLRLGPRRVESAS